MTKSFNLTKNDVTFISENYVHETAIDIFKVFWFLRENKKTLMSNVEKDEYVDKTAQIAVMLSGYRTDSFEIHSAHMRFGCFIVGDDGHGIPKLLTYNHAIQNINIKKNGHFNIDKEWIRKGNEIHFIAFPSDCLDLIIPPLKISIQAVISDAV